MPPKTKSPPPHHLELALSPETARRITADHSFGHRLLMSMLPDSIFDTDSPRAEAGLLWGFTSPTTFHVVSRLPLTSARDVNVTMLPTPPDVKDGQLILLTGTIEASQMKATWVPEEIWNLPGRPNTHGKRVPVPTDRLRPWLTDKLARAGFGLTDVLTLSTHQIPVKKRKIHSADFTVKTTVTDATLAQDALDTGCGRSKNFGCGLLRATPI
ncbi:type I-E CRISPR-associated protein Cas6/Cse3/CasE [Corynebacterium sp.]|uniref:type I-E CRISPR-associated protein Cas6/Cse3/CasE n=1 Tax=Corynebacterium sp. TaxID=1720 RepID=UPI0028AF834B|nr:type I-E CRISPR-associated protein Cas6/Cse3/CasE [Corynebacterium sp.]